MLEVPAVPPGATLTTGAGLSALETTHGHGPHPRSESPGLTAEVLALLTDDPGVLDLVVQPGAARNPDGDTMVCDVLTGAANRVLRGLRDLRLDQRGSVVVDPVGMAFSARADDAAKQLGSMARAPVWEEVDARIRAEGTYAPSFYLHLVVAGLIASVGIVTNSQILIVAAMVVGPEYGAIVSIALGVDRRDRTRIREGAFALGAGFLLAITVTFVDWLAGLSAGKRSLVRGSCRTNCGGWSSRCRHCPNRVRS